MTGFDKFLILLGVCWGARKKKPKRSVAEQVFSESPIVFWLIVTLSLLFAILICG